eukprot:10915435-Alexandrium_andersonii.AAC.1
MPHACTFRVRCTAVARKTCAHRSELALPVGNSDVKPRLSNPSPASLVLRRAHARARRPPVLVTSRPN